LSAGCQWRRPLTSGVGEVVPGDLAILPVRSVS
jgi:hypothetical protein